MVHKKNTLYIILSDRFCRLFVNPDGRNTFVIFTLFSIQTEKILFVDTEGTQIPIAGNKI